MMKVLKTFGNQDLRIVEKPIPEPGPGHVRIKVRASGVCGSDKWIWYTENETDNIAGHEVAGEVVKIGEGVDSLKLGDRVMINNVVGCGMCPACLAGAFVLCGNRAGQLDVNNGFGEYLIAPARNCVRLADGIDYIDGALIMDNWGTPYGGTKRGNIQLGMNVLVTGCGPIGQAAIALSAATGAQVVAVDPLEFRRQNAKKSGAVEAVAPQELQDIRKKITGDAGFDLVLECSGNGKIYDNCLESLRIGGDMIAIGEHAEYLLHPSDQIIRRSLSIIGTWYSTLPQANEVMQLAVNKKINLRSFLTHTISLEEAPEIFKSIIDYTDDVLKCVIVFD